MSKLLDVIGVEQLDSILESGADLTAIASKRVIWYNDKEYPMSIIETGPNLSSTEAFAVHVGFGDTESPMSVIETGPQRRLAIMVDFLCAECKHNRTTAAVLRDTSEWGTGLWTLVYDELDDSLHDVTLVEFVCDECQMENGPL